MAKSKHSTIVIKKRRERRKKLAPYEKSIYMKLAAAANNRESQESQEILGQVNLSAKGRWAKKKKTIEGSRSLRSGVKNYKEEKVVATKYQPKHRDYSKILDDSALDSDRGDIMSDSGDDAQEASRQKDPRKKQDKRKLRFQFTDVDGLLMKYRRKHQKFPKWMSKREIARVGGNLTTHGEFQDEKVIISDSE